MNDDEDDGYGDGDDDGDDDGDGDDADDDMQTFIVFLQWEKMENRRF